MGIDMHLHIKNYTQNAILKPYFYKINRKHRKVEAVQGQLILKCAPTHEYANCFNFADAARSRIR